MASSSHPAVVLLRLRTAKRYKITAPAASSSIGTTTWSQDRCLPTEKGKRETNRSEPATVTRPTNLPGSGKLSSKLIEPVG